MAEKLTKNQKDVLANIWTSPYKRHLIRNRLGRPHGNVTVAALAARGLIRLERREQIVKPRMGNRSKVHYDPVWMYTYVFTEAGRATAQEIVSAFQEKRAKEHKAQCEEAVRHLSAIDWRSLHADPLLRIWETVKKMLKEASTK